MKLEIHPLTINQAFMGRRFKTQAYKDYETEMLWLIKAQKPKKVSGWVEVEYHFYIKHFLTTDTCNMEKLLTDILVKAGCLDDDRFIIRAVMTKHAICKDEKESIDITIKKYE